MVNKELEELYLELATQIALDSLEAEKVKGGLDFGNSEHKLRQATDQYQQDIHDWFVGLERLIFSAMSLLQPSFENLSFDQKHTIHQDLQRLQQPPQTPLDTHTVLELYQFYSLSNPFFEWIYAEALEKITQHQEEQALILLAFCVFLKPSLTEAWLAMSYCFKALESLDQALEIAQMIIAMDPQQILAHCIRLECLIKTRDAKTLDPSAWKEFNQALERHHHKQQFEDKKHAFAKFFIHNPEQE